jgi:hypothetical protein
VPRHEHVRHHERRFWFCPTFLVTTFALLGRTIESHVPSLYEAMPFHLLLWRTDRTNLMMAIFSKRKEKQLKVGRRVPTSCKTKTIVEPTDETSLLSIHKPSKHHAGKERRKFWFSKNASKHQKQPTDEKSVSLPLHTTVLIQEQPKQQDESITSDDSTFLVDDMSYSLPSTDSMFTEQRQSTADVSRMFCGVEGCAGIQFVEDTSEHPSSVSSSSSSKEKSTVTIRDGVTQVMRIMERVKEEMDAFPFPARAFCGANAQDDDISLSLASFTNSEITGITSTDHVKLPASVCNMFGIFGIIYDIKFRVVAAILAQLPLPPPRTE